MKKTKLPTPPAWAQRFLRWYCDPSLIEDLQGDLQELFLDNYRRHGLLRARLKYVADVVLFLRPYLFRKDEQESSFIFLLRNYFRSSLRSLYRSKLNTSLNLFGLTISITGFTLIWFFISDELRYDKHYDKADRIYRITVELQSETNNSSVAWADAHLGHRLKELYPEVEDATALIKMSGKVKVSTDLHEDREENFYRAERSYFQVFSHRWVAGNPGTSLDKPASIVLTKALAVKYFGNESALDQTLTVHGEDFTVTGIVEDIPTHTDLRFDAVMSTDKETLAETDFWAHVFILFKEIPDEAAFYEKLKMTEKYLNEEFAASGTKISYQMEPLTSVHFGTKKLFDTAKSSKSNIYIFSAVALFILVIASINYINLSVAHAVKKNAEAGVRKILGATAPQLRKQYLFESFMLCVVCGTLALGLSALMLHSLNVITGKNLQFLSIVDAPFAIAFVLVVLIPSLVGGAFPALHLSAVNPAESIKGHARVIHLNRSRNALIVVQFTASIALLICTGVVMKQNDLFIGTNPGFKTSQVLVVDVPQDETVVGSMQMVKEKIQELPFVKSVSLAGGNSVPTTDADVDSYEVTYRDQQAKKLFKNIAVDEDYVGLLGIELVEGRLINNTDAEAGNTVVLVNESFVRQMEWTHPLDEVLVVGQGQFEVCGVVKDFHFNSLHHAIEPMVIHANSQSPEKMMVQVDVVDFGKISELEKIWKKNLYNSPFDFEFLDAYFDRQYAHEKTMQQLLMGFSGFIMAIACLGLVGLIAVTTAQKASEFAIRKVLGAGLRSISLLIIREFVGLIALGALLAVPIAWFSMDRWLSNIAYKINPGASVFVIPIVITVTIALLAMAYHTLKASNENPVERLKNI